MMYELYAFLYELYILPHVCCMYYPFSSINYASNIMEKFLAINIVLRPISLLYLASIFFPVWNAQSVIQISAGCLDFCAAPCIGICAHSRVSLLSHFLNFLSLSSLMASALYFYSLFVLYLYFGANFINYLIQG